MNKTLSLLTLTVILLLSCNEAPKRYRIGVSQCSEDIWRHKQNKELVIGSYITDNVDLEFLSAGDNDQKQIEQIRYLTDKNVDLIIVAPNSAEPLAPVLDEAYDKGIPIIFFDRKTNSGKYTAYVGADNYNVGRTMGELIGNDMGGEGVLVEITGLKGSSSAMERHRGFTDAMKNFPGIKVISSTLGDWTEKSGERAMTEVLEKYSGPIDCLFGHNDRLAMGARRMAQRHGRNDIVYYGVDALPTPGGGIELVQQGVLKASYDYPTQGVEVMRLAMKILRGEKVKKTHMLESTIVDKGNAERLLMQYREQQRVAGDIESLYGKLDTYFSQVNIQQKVIIFCIIVIVLVIFLTVYTYRSYVAKIRLNIELKQRNEELQNLYRQLEDMADSRLVFFTNVGHKLRTPLTLISGPVEKLANDKTIRGEAKSLVDIMQRNMATLTKLVDEILDFRKIGTEEIARIDDGATADTIAEENAIEETRGEGVEQHDSEKPVVLVVDDNADVRRLLKACLKEKYNVVLAVNGKEGLETARKVVPDLIVSDVMMPVMDGLEMCREVKGDAVTSHIPVLMLTARALEEHRMEGYAHGADAYITKPFTESLLQIRIENLLTSRQTLRKAFSSHVAAVTPKEGEETKGRQEKALKEVARPEDNIQCETFITRLREIIQSNISDSDFSVEKIGETLCMSRVQLYRKTKSMTGASPVELIRKARMEKGRFLLENTDKTISEVAYEVGFSAPSYFTKCFKDEYGVSPAEFRA